jgi:plastocyanin
MEMFNALRKSVGKMPTRQPAGRRRYLPAVAVLLLLSPVCRAATETVNVGQGGLRFVDQVSNTSTSVINEGDTVQWIWQSGPHSTTSGTCSSTCTADGKWDSGVNSNPHTFNFTFNTAGTFPYFCSIHTTAMIGKVIVNPVVTNTNDSGAGSLRQAILDLNADPDLTTITFNIPGGGVHTIIPLSALPVMTHPGVLDGTSQPGWVANAPVIELDGASAGASAVGLSIQAGNTTVRGLVINRFAQGGIVLQSNGNTITGNFIGTNSAGNTSLANGGVGILIPSGESNNTIGGATAAARNVISGNSLYGIQIAGLGTNGNTVEGNFIGADVSGVAAIANGADGVRIQSGAANNIIGGISTGAGNVISGNVGNGIIITGGGTTGNVVLGNLIGTNAAGTSALGNGQNGMLLNNTASGNTVGGQIASAANIISGNSMAGIAISDSGTTMNGIQGNFIGTNPAGSAAIPNTTGVMLENGTSNNLIGGTVAAARNVISGNGNNGVLITGTGTSGNTVAANFIGINAAGTAALGNNPNGVLLNNGAAANTIGGQGAGQGNVISGNAGAGISISDSSTSNNQVFGNFIGANPAGNGAIANSNGVLLLNSTSNNTIGGTSATARNIISGNNSTGVTLSGAGTTGNVVQGNFIGADVTGATAVGNSVGVFLVNSASGDFVGGTAPGAGNVISGNSSDGIEIAGANGNMVEGNMIGANAGGFLALANGVGVYLTSSANNTIGGTSAGARNIISGNSSYGMLLAGTGANANLVQGNFIGADAGGVAALGNGGGGVTLFNGPSGNTIGGTAPGAGNVISGNVTDGVTFSGVGTSGNVVAGNFIGTNAAGTAALGNTGNGMNISSGAANNTIGGPSASARNIISGNSQNGVTIFGSGSNGNSVQGNFIGTDASGVASVGNGVDGARVDTGVGDIIGGTAAGMGNVIAFNAKGVVVVNNAATGDAIEGNSIFSNTGLGIDLNDDGVTPNSPGGPHTGPNNLQNYPVLSAAGYNGSNTSIQGTLNSAANTTFHVEFFSNPACGPSGNGQGKSLLAATSVTTDNGGSVTINASFSTGNTAGQFISATATDPSGNTSEFSACQRVSFPISNTSGRNLHVRLGQPFTLLVATFVADPLNTPSQFSGSTIDWGDGATPSAATIISAGAGNFSVLGTHAYTKVSGWNVTVNIVGPSNNATANSKARLWPKPLSY